MRLDTPWRDATGGAARAEGAGTHPKPASAAVPRPPRRGLVGDVRFRLTITTAKSRRDQSVPLPARLVDLLSAYRNAAARPAGTVIPARGMPNTLTFDRDLAAAGIEKRDDQGRVVDRHALRTTMISWLAATGAHPRTAQALARHADVETTMQRYTDVRLLDTRAAVDRLPLPGTERRAVKGA